MSRATPVLLGVFFAVATCILVAVGIALLWPRTPLDAIWVLKPDRRSVLEAHRWLLGPGFLALAGPMAFACVGCFARRQWARPLAIAIFALNGVGDVAQLFLGHLVEGVIGVAVAGLLIIWLTRPVVRDAFA